MLIGYVRCWYQFCTSDFDPWGKRETIYLVGIATGLGGVIGYFDIDEGKEQMLNATPAQK